MERQEAETRDRVLRNYLEGRSWDQNDEFLLVRTFVQRSEALLPDLPFLVDYEWDVVPGKTDQGKGDLVFSDGAGRFAVVEVKFIDLARTGPTARAKRTDSRSKVQAQALDYAQRLRERLGSESCVEAWWFTNEVDRPVSAEGAAGNDIPQVSGAP